jgi:biopolymer transport protein ExbD
MRIKDASIEGEEPFNLVPLTDMVFNLLIFFMCATTFAQIEKEMAVQLPRTSAAVQPLSDTPRQLIINIKEDGQAFVAAKALDEQGLSTVLADAMKRDPNREVLIRADERSIMRHYARVVSLCRQAGVRESKLGYLDDSPTPVKVGP